MKTFISILASFLLISFSFGRDVVVSWNQNPETNIAKYNIWRVDGGARILLGTTPSVVSPALPQTTLTINGETGWSIAATAVNSAGLESLLSASVIIPEGPPPPTAYTIISVSSQEVLSGDHQVAYAFDGNPATWWEAKNTIGFPHEIQVDLGREYDVSGLTYLPCQIGTTSGIIGKFEVYVTNDLTSWGAVAGAGEFAMTLDKKTFNMTKKLGRYVKFKALTAANGSIYASIAELTFLLADPPLIVAPSKPTGLKVEFVR